MKLENLFKWSRKLQIMDKEGNPVIVRTRPLILHQRIVGDSDLMLARKMALKASRKLRLELRDELSDSYLAMMPDYGGIGDEQLRNMVILAESTEIRTHAFDSAKKPRKPVTPGKEATLEMQEQYEADLEEYKELSDTALRDRINELIEARKKQLSKLSRREVEEIFIDSTVTSLCQTEFLRTFNSWCAYLGTYRDSNFTKRAFEDYTAFENAAVELKSQIIDGYVFLEISGEDLKN